jgi:hypothetical protein
VCLHVRHLLIKNKNINGIIDILGVKVQIKFNICFTFDDGVGTSRILAPSTPPPEIVSFFTRSRSNYTKFDYVIYKEKY